MRGSGGTEGGLGLFVVGAILAVLGIYLFFDSVGVRTDDGLFSGMLGGRGRHGGGIGRTTSMGILFVPFIVSIIGLFYDARKKWAWWLLFLGITIIAIEVLSRIRFYLDTKLTHLLLMMALFGAGVGLILRSLKESEADGPS